MAKVVEKVVEKGGVKSGADLFLADMNKLFSKDSGVMVPDIDSIKVVKFQTGSLALDIYLDGGIPKGKMFEAFGKNQSGKSSLCLEAAGKFQETYPEEHILFLDLEDTFTPEYALNLGLNPHKNFILMKPKTGEDSFETLIKFAKNLKGGLIILDSVSLLLPEKEDEGEMGAHQMGSQAKLMSQGLRKLFPHAAKNGTTVMFINQIRDTFDTYKPVATSGGNALAFYTRTRLNLSKVKSENPLTTGNNIKLEKSTYGKEGTTVNTARLIKGRFDVMSEIIQISCEIGLMERAGSYYKYDGTTIGQGMAAVRELLADNPELMKELEMKIRKHFGI